MAKPVILTIDDDPDVLRAIERDLRRHYSDRFRILKADSGSAGIDAIRQLKLRNDAVALFLSDHRMPQMDGVEFLRQALAVYPEAKRVLLTAYADTDAAIRAINGVGVDYYLLKPWDPPEERLYPVLDDLLNAWEATHQPPFAGVRVVGHRWSPETHTVKDFLARNNVPYQWLDIEVQAAARQLLELSGADIHSLPLVLFEDGTHLVAPTNMAVAERVGLKTHAEMPFYDLAIIGSGPAGLAAAVYGGSEGLNTLVVEREAPGGQAGTSSRIENYLGFPNGLSGAELTQRAVQQARKFHVEILTPQEVTSVKADGPSKVLTLGDGTTVSCKALMIASGVAYRKLDVPGMDALTGAGVYYGAAQTEGLSCSDEEVYIVGGANSAGQAALFFARYAAHVTMLVRGESLSKSMSQYLIDEIAQRENIIVRPCCTVAAVQGDGRLETLTLANADTGTQETVPAAALFIFIGAMPRTDWLAGVVERDAQGFVLTGPDVMHDGRRPRGWSVDRDPFLLETSVPGIFAAGDVRAGSVKRVASGVGEGAIAVQFVHRYLAQM